MRFARLARSTLALLSLTAIACSFVTPRTALAGEAAEQAAAAVLEERMKTQRPEDLAILKAVKGKEVVVVQGSMDHIEQVLAAANIRHTVIHPNQVGAADLHANQIVMVNCPGTMPTSGVRRIERFVRAGGSLYTTDWALLNVVQKAFPGTIAHNGRSTGDHVTHVHVDAKHTHDDLMSNVLLREGTKPQWWLEGGSYPVKILNQRKVAVLAKSDEMARKYGAAPVVVRFRWEDGEVVHVVSHFYRQIGTKGPQVAAKNALGAVDGLTADQKAALANSGAGDVSMSELSSSYAFQQMTGNLVVSKSKRNVDLDKRYRWQAKRGVKMEGRKVPKGARLKLLERKDGKVRLRDDRGNEAWLDDDDVEAR